MTADLPRAPHGLPDGARYRGGTYRIDRAARRAAARARVDGPGGSPSTEQILTRYGAQGDIRPARGLHLLGEYQDSGFERPRYLARRGDGQVLQLTRLLYLVMEAVCAGHDLAGVAGQVGRRYGKNVSPDNVAYLLSTSLVPLGLVRLPGTDRGPAADRAPRSNLLLGLSAARVLLPARAVAVPARALAWLHHPVAVAVVLAGFAAFDGWLFAVHGAASSLLQVFTNPAAVLVAMGLSLVGMFFHELGHASACRYGGATPGAIGVGIYLVWPAAYTDVTDVYRIGCAGRVRTDLGGVYFNAVFVLGLGAAYALTGQPLFLAVAFVTHFEMLQQLVPVFRMDGYYILGDLAGIPDLFGKVKPILAGLLPGHELDARVSGLRRRTRVTVTVWVLAVAAVITANVAYLLWNLPVLVPAVVHTIAARAGTAAAAFAAGHVVTGVIDAIGVLLLLVPFVGIGYLLVRLARRAYGLARTVLGLADRHRGTARHRA